MTSVDHCIISHHIGFYQRPGPPRPILSCFNLPIDKLSSNPETIQELEEQLLSLCWSITTFLSWEDLDGVDAVLVEAGLNGVGGQVVGE